MIFLQLVLLVWPSVHAVLQQPPPVPLLSRGRRGQQQRQPFMPPEDDDFEAAALQPLPPVPPLPDVVDASVPELPSSISPPLVSFSQEHVSSYRRGGQVPQVGGAVSSSSEDTTPHESLTREDLLAARAGAVAAPPPAAQSSAVHSPLPAKKLVALGASAAEGAATRTATRTATRAAAREATNEMTRAATSEQLRVAAAGAAGAVAQAPAPAPGGGVMAAVPAARAKPKGWDQCLQFARFVRTKGASGVELVRVWKSTCEPAVRSGRASERYRLMCNSLGGAVEPFSHQADYNVEELCDAVLSVFHDITAADTDF
jgi:hypothetical protein